MDRYLPTDKIDVYHTDLDDGYWTTHKTDGEIPPGTSGAVAILVKYNLYIFGGHTELGHPSNDLYCCDLRTLTWEKVIPKSEQQPCPRDKFIGCHANNKLYYFGGYGYKYDDYDKYLIETGKFVVDYSHSNVTGKGWNDQLVVFDIEEKTWSDPGCKGIAPLARAAHASILLGNTLYIFGGRHQDRRLNDLHCLNIDTLTWSGELHTEGPIPCGRSWHTFTAISKDQGFMYGGYSHSGVPLSDAWVLNVVDKRWCQLDVPSDRPRLWHTCCCCADNGDIMVFGGCENDILNWEQESIHSNAVITFQLQPPSLKRLCLQTTYHHVNPEYWNDLPKMLSDWLHKREKLEQLKRHGASNERSNLRKGSTCVIS
ncbi:Kelch domain-containing protein 2 [Mactra antiquata]